MMKLLPKHELAFRDQNCLPTGGFPSQLGKDTERPATLDLWPCLDFYPEPNEPETQWVHVALMRRAPFFGLGEGNPKKNRSQVCLWPRCCDTHPTFRCLQLLYHTLPQRWGVRPLRQGEVQNHPNSGRTEVRCTSG